VHVYIYINIVIWIKTVALLDRFSHH
jgi:hypothetical protein